MTKTTPYRCKVGSAERSCLTRHHPRPLLLASVHTSTHRVSVRTTRTSPAPVSWLHSGQGKYPAHAHRQPFAFPKSRFHTVPGSTGSHCAIASSALLHAVQRAPDAGTRYTPTRKGQLSPSTDMSLVEARYFSHCYVLLVLASYIYQNPPV